MDLPTYCHLDKKNNLLILCRYLARNLSLLPAIEGYQHKKIVTLLDEITDGKKTLLFNVKLPEKKDCNLYFSVQKIK